MSITITPIASAAHATLDVRPILAAGDDPLSLIMAAARAIPPGGTLRITAPFEPEPLYAVLAELGFDVAVDATDPVAVIALFARATLDAATPVREIIARYPVTAEILHGRGLDSCCGGAHPLEMAAGAHGVLLAPLLAQLQAAVTAAPGL